MCGKAKSKRKTNLAEDTYANVKTILNVCLVKIYGQSSYCLLDTVGIPDLILITLIQQMDLTAWPTKRTITMADGTMAKCRCVVNDSPATFGELKTKIDFLVVEGFFVGLLI